MARQQLSFDYWESFSICLSVIQCQVLVLKNLKLFTCAIACTVISAEMSLMIEKEWKSLSLEDQLGALLYCISNLSAEKAKISLETSSEPDVVYPSHLLQPPSSQALVPTVSRGSSIKSPLERLGKGVHMSKFPRN